MIARFKSWLQDRLTPAKYAAISRFVRYTAYQVAGIIAANAVIGVVWFMLQFNFDATAVAAFQVVATAGMAAVTRGVKYAQTGIAPEPVDPPTLTLPQGGTK